MGRDLVFFFHCECEVGQGLMRFFSFAGLPRRAQRNRFLRSVFGNLSVLLFFSFFNPSYRSSL